MVDDPDTDLPVTLWIVADFGRIFAGPLYLSFVLVKNTNTSFTGVLSGLNQKISCI